MSAVPDAPARLLSLLGLALRARKLAVGASAVMDLVRRDKRPLVVIAKGVGEGQRERLLRLTPVRGVVLDVVTGDELAKALGRQQLVVVALSDQSFIRGIVGLGLVQKMAGSRRPRRAEESDKMAPRARKRVEPQED